MLLVGGNVPELETMGGPNGDVKKRGGIGAVSFICSPSETWTMGTIPS
jgi:hypothetical protein